MSTKKVPVNRVDINHGRWHLRVHADPAGVEKLKHHFLLHGQREPLLVRPTPGQRPFYQLIAGVMRLEAARLLNWDHVLVRVVDVDEARAATLALTHEVQVAHAQSFLERGWAVVKTLELRHAAGLPTALRVVASDCMTTKSTLENAKKIGTALPCPTVRAVTSDLNIPLVTVLGIPQTPLLVIARQQPSLHRRLFEAAAHAHAKGDDPAVAVENALSPASEPGSHSDPPVPPNEDRGRTRLGRRADGRLYLKMKEPATALSPAERRRLAQEFRSAARQLERPGRQDVQRVQPVQGLDKMTAWLAQALRRVTEALARAYGEVRSKIRAQ